LVEHLPGDANATGLGDPLKPRRDVNSVPIDPGLVVDHVTEVDPDAEEHAAVLRDRLVARRHDGLELDRAFDRADHTRKLGQDAVASRVDDAAAIAANQGEDHGLVSLEVAHRGGIVLAHQPAVASDIGGQNGDKSTLHRGFFVH
jgi:hypothetical protein